MFERGTVIAALQRCYVRLLPIAWRVPRPGAASTDVIIANLGSVEIRRVPAGCFIGTSVSGEPEPARETALQRITDYLNGNNRGKAVLEAERPVIQQQVGPRRWRISVRLRMAGADVAAPAPCAPKVKLTSVPAELLAVVRVRGRQAHDAVADADAVLLDAIASSEWVVVGAPMLRLHAFGPLQRVTGGFEVGATVAARPLRRELPRRAAETSGATAQY